MQLCGTGATRMSRTKPDTSRLVRQQEAIPRPGWSEEKMGVGPARPGVANAWRAGEKKG